MRESLDIDVFDFPSFAGEWQLRCVAYTGNNMRKSSQAKQERMSDPNELDLASVYLSYAEAGVASSDCRPRTGRSKSASTTHLQTV